MVGVVGGRGQSEGRVPEQKGWGRGWRRRGGAMVCGGSVGVARVRGGGGQICHGGLGWGLGTGVGIWDGGGGRHRGLTQGFGVGVWGWGQSL